MALQLTAFWQLAALRVFNLATAFLPSRSVWDFHPGLCRDMPEREGYPSIDIRPKLEPVTISFDSPELIQLQDNDRLEATPSTVVSLRPHSPDSHSRAGVHSSSTRDSGLESFEDHTDSPTEPEQRSGSVSSTGGKSDKDKVEKRKRSRVTPEQLVHLERFFLVDRSPTAARRREISELLGMQERQTQIWFQNRRAKAKLQDGKQKGRGASVDVPPPDSPPRLSTGLQVDLQNLIHEDEPVTIIPCTDLTIGSWRRIATTVAKHDLVAYVCEGKRCLTWFIHSVGFGFKMEIPFETIVNTVFTNAAPGSGLATFVLSEPPLFYLENIGPDGPDGTPTRHWKRCSDWTEGQQATRVLRHDLIGSAVQLAHLLRNLHTNSTSEIPLRPPAYRSEQSTTVAAMELPRPPMANLSGPGYHYQSHDAVESPVPHQGSQYPKRSSYAGPGITTASPDSAYSNDDDRAPPYSAPSTAPVSFSQHQSYPYGSSVAGRTSAANFGVEGAHGYADFSSVEPHRQAAPHGGQDDYSDMRMSHGVVPRPYSAQPAPRAYYPDTSQPLQPYQADDVRMRRASAPSSAAVNHVPHASQHAHFSHQHGLQHQDPHHQHYIQPSPSPPLLTTPYHPPAHLLDQTGHGDRTCSTSPVASYPGTSEHEDYRQHRRDYDSH
ncbi:putative homeodomain containing protein [Lyophyllum shimeji]|uniref:Homeodomain containing protein n=1 Tax=Lyophyllum shimeji TaxID=47721 RepID=A0A9P3PRW4_LYOSH|nr:putative homeodomain containing protein [Lyophyllum shimeji]